MLYMVQMLLHRELLFLVAQMLYANLIVQMLLSIVKGTDVIMPILVAQMCMCKPYCPDVIEHCEGMDVIMPILVAQMLCASLIAQMLLSIV